MLHARTRQTLTVLAAIAVVCSFVGGPVATAAALGDESNSGLDGLDNDEQTSTDDGSSTEDGSTDDSTDDTDDSTDDGDANDGGDSTDDTGDSTDDTDDSTDDTDDSADGGDANDGGDSANDGSTDDGDSDSKLGSDDSSDDEDSEQQDQVEDIVNETTGAIEDASDDVEDGSTDSLEDDGDGVGGTIDRVVNYVDLQSTLSVDVFTSDPLESGTGPTDTTYTYAQSPRTDASGLPEGGSAAGDDGATKGTAASAAGDGDGDGDGPEPANPAGGAGIGVGAVVTAAALRGSPVVSGSRAARSSGLLSTLLEKVRPFVLPLRYSRYDDSDPLEHDARERVYEIVNETPGSYLSEVSQVADLPLSTTRHHIKVLEREDLVSGAKIHGKRRFYPAYAEGIELAAALNDESTASIIRAIARVGAASVSDLAEELSRDPSTISHHLQRLEEDGLITRERDGRAVVNKLSPEARTTLEPETAPAAPERSEAIAGGAD